MARLVDPKTGTAVHVDGSLELRYRKQGWSESTASEHPDDAVELANDPVEPVIEEPVAVSEHEQPDEADDKPATRRNTRRTK